jgi:hypothetical protein
MGAEGHEGLQWVRRLITPVMPFLERIGLFSAQRFNGSTRLWLIKDGKSHCRRAGASRASGALEKKMVTVTHWLPVSCGAWRRDPADKKATSPLTTGEARLLSVRWPENSNGHSKESADGHQRRHPTAVVLLQPPISSQVLSPGNPLSTQCPITLPQTGSGGSGRRTGQGDYTPPCHPGKAEAVRYVASRKMCQGLFSSLKCPNPTRFSGDRTWPLPRHSTLKP